MKTLLLLAVTLVLVSSAAFADDAILSIEPDPYVSSDHVTICRVVARNVSRRTLDGRSIGFEAQAWENGVQVMREKGRFAGAVGPGETAETQIGFNGVFTDVRVVPAAAKGSGRTGARRGGKSAKSGSGSRTKRSSSKSGASKTSRRGGGK